MSFDRLEALHRRIVVANHQLETVTLERQNAESLMSSKDSLQVDRIERVINNDDDDRKTSRREDSKDTLQGGRVIQIMTADKDLIQGWEVLKTGG